MVLDFLYGVGWLWLAPDGYATFMPGLCILLVIPG